jgi:hypothetical protein
MKKKFLITAAIAMFTSTALAGLYQPALFIVDLDAQFAQGDMLSVANSVNSDAFIGCGTRRTSIPAAGVDFRTGFCQAGDDDGNVITCFTEDPALIDEMRASNDHSFITFNWAVEIDPTGNENYVCTRVGFSTQSFYIDKVKN